MPELITQHGDVFLEYGDVSVDQYREVRYRLTRHSPSGANWFCTFATVTFADGQMEVRFALNDSTTTDVVKTVIAIAFRDVNTLKGIAS